MTFVGPIDPDAPSWAFDIRGTVLAPGRRREVGDVRRIVLHRVGGPTWPETAVPLIAALSGAWYSGTGEGVCPYAFLVEPRGRVVAVHPLTRCGRHAGRYTPLGAPAGSYNKEALAIGLVGDFRKQDPSPGQWKAALRLAQWCTERFELGVHSINGHDELPGATPGKVCPGDRWDMMAFRADLSAGAGHTG